MELIINSNYWYSDRFLNVFFLIKIMSKSRHLFHSVTNLSEDNFQQGKLLSPENLNIVTISPRTTVSRTYRLFRIRLQMRYEVRPESIQPFLISG